LTRITGDPIWADRYEDVVFNSLPASFDPSQRALHYVTCANCAELGLEAATRGQFDNKFPMLAYKSEMHDYRCCIHNYGMAWPGYAQDLWHATFDNGLCASMYGACDVEARVGRGTTVRIEQTTRYPFGDSVHFKVGLPAPTAFPLYLRIPRWCRSASVYLNGETLSTPASPGSYVVIERIWSDSDVVELRLPMATDVRRWRTNRNAASVYHGPVGYSLEIDADWERVGGTDDWPWLAVKPKSAWNYALVLDHRRPSAAFSTIEHRDTDPNRPFEPDNVPRELQARARRVPGWTVDKDGITGTLPQSPVASGEPDETVTLIPMGAAHLRIASFPVVGETRTRRPAPRTNPSLRITPPRADG
jgi:hypothetical protein